MSAKIIASFSGDIQTGIVAPALPDKYAGKWAGNLKNAVPEMIDGNASRIPDELTYQSKVVEPSTTRWNSLVNPAFVSKKGKPAAVVIATRMAKMTTSYSKWLTGLSKAFADQGQAFKKAVDARSGDWARNYSAYGLPFTGAGGTKKGPTIFIQEFLTGNPNYIATLPAEWAHDGPCNIVKPGMASAFKPMVAGLLTQMMNFSAVTNFDPAVLAMANGKIVIVMNALLNTAVANTFAAPDAAPNSSLILSGGDTTGVLHVECKVRLGV